MFVLNCCDIIISRWLLYNIIGTLATAATITSTIITSVVFMIHGVIFPYTSSSPQLFSLDPSSFSTKYFLILRNISSILSTGFLS